MRHESTKGECPYCGANNFNEGQERRPGQRVDRCQPCDKFSVLSRQRRFPLEDPTDEQSAPYR